MLNLSCICLKRRWTLIQGNNDLNNIFKSFGRPNNNPKFQNHRQNNLWSSFTQPSNNSGIGSSSHQGSGSNSKYLTVSQADQLISRGYRDNPKLQNLYVTGEISSFRPRPGRYKAQFITLSQKLANGRTAEMNCVIFGGIYSKLKFKLHQSMNINVYGRWGMYTPYGTSSLQVMHLEPANGVGALQLALKQEKARLMKAGRFNPAHKKPIPKWPHRIAIITSQSGQAVHDTTSRINSRYPLAKVDLFPALVQGHGAPKSLIEKLKLADALNVYDTIIIGRGGGALEDLQAFNNEDLINAIYFCHTPVISAVGHKENWTFCDEVADKRAPVPAQAGNIAVPDMSEVMKQVNDDFEYIKSSVNDKLNQFCAQFKDLASSYVFTNPDDVLFNTRAQVIDNLDNSLHNYEASILEQRKDALTRLSEQLAKDTPLNKINAQSTNLVSLSAKLDANLQQKLQSYQNTYTKVSSNLEKHNPDKAIDRVDNQVTLLGQKMDSKIQNIINDKLQTLQNISGKMVKNSPLPLINLNIVKLSGLSSKLNDNMKAILQNKTSELKKDSESLAQLDYHHVLARGFNLAHSFDNSNQIIKSAKSAKQAKLFKIQFHDGVVPVVAVSKSDAEAYAKRLKSNDLGIQNKKEQK